MKRAYILLPAACFRIRKGFRELIAAPETLVMPGAYDALCNHAHLVPEGIDGFLGGLDVKRMGEVRVADCFGTKEEHLKPGKGNIDFAGMFRKLDALGYRGQAGLA